MAEGLSNLDIADRLYVTEQTVKFHLSNIYRKLGVANRTEATRYAYRNRLIECRESAPTGGRGAAGAAARRNTSRTTTTSGAARSAPTTACTSG